jgi:hypothetical protein
MPMKDLTSGNKLAVNTAALAPPSSCSGLEPPNRSSPGRI